jgi:hypothetical protein
MKPKPSAPTAPPRAGLSISRREALTRAILNDRVRRKSQPRQSTRPKAPEPNFDLFAVTKWRVVTGGAPGYLPKTPMRRGPIGWCITCGHCGAEFESKGWKYCPACMELPAEGRRSKPAISDRPCCASGCTGFIPRRRRADAKYCTDRCAKAAENARGYRGSAHPKFRGDTCEIPQSNQWAQDVLIGPRDFPINVIGGYRFPRAKAVPGCD